MPDNQDYEHLRRLLEEPTSWTSTDADLVRSFLQSQREAVADCHPKDAVRRQAMSRVADHMEAALRSWEATA